jgi:hypothetical protein
MDNFSKRLLQACASNDDIPEFGKGQQTYIAEKLGVSQEAVRKWFASESTPRSSLAGALSKLLGVKHSWLMLGTGHGEIETDIMTARRHEFSIYALMAFLVGKGVGATFADENAFSDITIIHRGEFQALSAEGAHKNGEFFEVTFSELQIAAGLTIANVVDFGGYRSAAVDFVIIDDLAWKTHGKKKGKTVTIQITQNPRSYTYAAGAMKLTKFLED